MRRNVPPTAKTDNSRYMRAKEYLRLDSGSFDVIFQISGSINPDCRRSLHAEGCLLTIVDLLNRTVLECPCLGGGALVEVVLDIRRNEQ